MSLKSVSEKKQILTAAGNWLAVAAILITAFCIRLPLLLAREAVLPGDEVMFGLMAKHILHGELPIFYWGQAYLGALEAYVTAVMTLIFGMNGITVQLGGFVFYELFLAANYFLLKRLLGFWTAVFTSVFLLASPVMMTELSIRALGGYSEILFLGALGLLCWVKVFDDGKRGYLIPLGLTLGIGLWTNSLFIVYLVAFGLLTFARFYSGSLNLPRTTNAPDVSHSVVRGLARLIFLRQFRLPVWLKIPFWTIHAVVFFYLIQQIFVFFHGGLDHKILGIAFKEPAFQWKGVKKILWLILGETAALTFLVLGWRRLLDWMKNWWGLAAGFLVGVSPSALYGLLGGEGYRLLHKSGAVPAHALWAKFETIFLTLIPKVLWGGNIFIILFFLAGLAYFVWIQRKAVKQASFFFCFLGASVLGITFVSALVADRYLVPFYWVTAVAAGALAAQITVRTKGLGALLVLPFVLFNLQAVGTYTHLLKQEDVRGLVNFLQTRGIRGGITDYDNSYRFNFYSNERVIFIPLVGIMRRVQYKEFVDGLDRKALIFPADSSNEKEYLAAYPDFKPLETHTFKTYRVYLVGHSFK